MVRVVSPVFQRYFARLSVPPIVYSKDPQKVVSLPISIFKGSRTVTSEMDESQQLPSQAISFTLYLPGPGKVYSGFCRLEVPLFTSVSPKSQLNLLAPELLLSKNTLKPQILSLAL